MAKIADIEKNQPHCVSKVICLNCLDRWLCVRSEKVLLQNIECKKCGQGYVIETGEKLSQPKRDNQ